MSDKEYKGIHVTEPIDHHLWWSKMTVPEAIAIEAICTVNKVGSEFTEFKHHIANKIEQYADTVASACLASVKGKVAQLNGIEAWIDDQQMKELCQRILSEIADGNYNP